MTVVTGGPEAALLAARLAIGLEGDARPERVGVIAGADPPERVDGVEWITVDAVEDGRTGSSSSAGSDLDVVHGIRRLLGPRAPVDRVIVLVDTDRDLASLTRTLLSEPDIRRGADLDGVLVTVDAVAMATRLAVELPCARHHELQRIAVADRIIVSRAGAVADQALGRVLRTIRTIGRLGYVAVPAITPIDLSVLVELRSWHGAPLIGSVQIDEPLLVDLHDEVPLTVCLEVEGLLDPNAVDEWFHQLIAAHGPQLLRVQGAVAVSDLDYRVCIRGVGDFVASHSEIEHSPADRSPRSLVAIVGYGLDAATLRSGFLAARSA